jgi:hypothetical protein
MKNLDASEILNVGWSKLAIPAKVEVIIQNAEAGNGGTFERQILLISLS